MIELWSFRHIIIDNRKNLYFFFVFPIEIGSHILQIISICFTQKMTWFNEQQQQLYWNSSSYRFRLFGENPTNKRVFSLGFPFTSALVFFFVFLTTSVTPSVLFLLLLLLLLLDSFLELCRVVSVSHSMVKWCHWNGMWVLLLLLLLLIVYDGN